MQLDKLQLDLHPRPNAQALDLGFSLLRAHAADAYLAWLGLWLPLLGLCAALSCFFPTYAGVFLLAAWWVRPMLERAPLYVLSRQVFGEEVGWREALRAWPRQFGGGWFFLLTWGRFFAAGRGLYQPIWQLEGARGSVAAERRKVIGRNNTARSAFWFGVACAHFEVILQLGLLALIGIFVSDEKTINPFALMIQIGNAPQSVRAILLSYCGYAVAGGVIGPIFVACGFTLYLNRRATLEAWDIEIALRQIKRPLHKGMTSTANRGSTIAALLAVLFSGGLLASLLLSSPPVLAAASASQGRCEVPPYVRDRDATHTADQRPEQVDLQHELTQLYDSDELRGYACQENWKYKYSTVDKPNPELPEGDGLHLNGLADIVKIVLIAAALFLIGWLLYRYRDQFAALARLRPAAKATEIAGMDIRPESLPEDVPARVAELWTQGQRSAALALLYRATISRLVSDNRLQLNQGATEGDCLRLAQHAVRRQELQPGRLQTAHLATDLWLRAAYGNRWPDDAAVAVACSSWRSEFASAPAPAEAPR